MVENETIFFQKYQQKLCKYTGTPGID